MANAAVAADTVTVTMENHGRKSAGLSVFRQGLPPTQHLVDVGGRESVSVPVTAATADLAASVNGVGTGVAGAVPVPAGVAGALPSRGLAVPPVGVVTGPGGAGVVGNGRGSPGWGRSPASEFRRGSTPAARSGQRRLPDCAYTVRTGLCVSSPAATHRPRGHRLPERRPGRPVLRLTVANTGQVALRAMIADLTDDGSPARVQVDPGRTHTEEIDAGNDANGWYDLRVTVDRDSAFSRRFAGHLENGENSRTGPDRH